LQPDYALSAHEVLINASKFAVQETNNLELYSAERGAPENIGTDLKAVHPVIRTNPVTGWKSVYAVGHHAKRINEVTKDESEHLLGWFTQLIVESKFARGLMC
jgi:alpha-ketoglutarate-dependent taurine dioxygenase